MKNLKTFEELNENNSNEIEFNSFSDFKQENKTVANSLAEFWAEMSRSSTASANRWLTQDKDGRYSFSKINGVYTFKDSDQQDTFTYDESTNKWDYTIMGGEPVDK